MPDDPRTQLRKRIRLLLGIGEEAERQADAIVALFTVVQVREQDVDITALSATHRELLRQPWIVAAVANGPTRIVKGEPLGLFDDFGSRP